MNIVQAKCPHCANLLRIPADWLEKPMRCKHCKNTFQAKSRVPEAAAPVPVPVAPPIAPPPAPPPVYQQPQPAVTPSWPAAPPPSPPMPQYYQPAPGAPPMILPPGYAPPGYPPPAYAPPGYSPPGYSPQYAPPPSYPPAGYTPAPPSFAAGPPPANNFGFDESQHDGHDQHGHLDKAHHDGEDTMSVGRRYDRKSKSLAGLFVGGGVLLAALIALIVLAPFIMQAAKHEPEKPTPVASKDKRSAKDLELAKANRKALEESAAGVKKKGSDGTPINPNLAPVRPIAQGGMPRRALFIAPVNYLFHNATPFYQLREGAGAGENALLYRFNTGAPMNMDRRQVFVLSDADENSGGAVPQKDVIEKAIVSFVETSRPQDRIVIFFSGHACDIDGKGYLIPIEGDKDAQESLIAIDWVYEQLAKCRARQKVFVLDAFRYPPARGLELPATGAMTEAVAKQLETPPPGVQVITACVANQQSLEFENGSIFQSAMLDSLRKMSQGTIVQPKDPLPLAEVVSKINGFMKENLVGAPGMAAMDEKKEDKKDDKDPKKDSQESPADIGQAQLCRLSGIEAAGGAEPDAKEPAPKEVVFFKHDKEATGLQAAKAILDEIKKFPPMKKSQAQQLANMTMSALPGAGKEIEEYKDEGFNPFMAADDAAVNQMKEKFPLRVMAYTISQKLKEHAELSMRELLSNPGGPLDAKAKTRFLSEQKDPALAVLDLEETLADAQKIAEERESEKSKRWQAHFDLALARLLTRLVYIYEYNNLLAAVRSDSLPNLETYHTGWRVNSSNKVQIKEASVKDMAKQAVKTWDRMGKEYAGTPWAVIAKRERNVAMGLQWVATKD
jgi:hypothetical protein